MRDFTLQSYRRYAEAIRDRGAPVLRFDAVLGRPAPERFSVLRHDVDRRPGRAVALARLEAGLGLTATYYVRARTRAFDPDAIRTIARLGHEIGYHYEALSDARGDREEALRIFDAALRRLRAVAPVRTIAMHGAPLSPWDNRELWRGEAARQSLRKRFGLLGEAYLDLDYAGVAYITDTGRSWQPDRHNLRDRVESDLSRGFAGGDELLRYLRSEAPARLVFSVHPERWTDGTAPWVLQAARDALANGAKSVLRGLRARTAPATGSERRRDGS